MIGRSASLSLITMTLVAVLIPAGAGAKVKLEDALYYQALKGSKVDGYLQADNGKVIGAGANVKYRDKANKTCVPEGMLAQTGGFIDTTFATKKVKPNGKGKFTTTNKPSATLPGLKATVKGRFKSSTKASFTIVLKADGCAAKATFKKASSR